MKERKEEEGERERKRRGNCREEGGGHGWKNEKQKRKMRSGKCDHVIKEGSEDVARGEVRGDGRCG
jgi:hypothetical protein